MVQLPGIDLLFEVVDHDNLLFGSETIGAVRGIDPTTGHHSDDNRRYIDALDIPDRDRVFEHNAGRVYPRLDVH
jgi:4-oxalmesaconate hydratase